MRTLEDILVFRRVENIPLHPTSICSSVFIVKVQPVKCVLNVTEDRVNN